MLSRLYTLLLVILAAWSSWAAFDDGWKGPCACALFLAFQIRFSDIRQCTLRDALLTGLVILLLLCSLKPPLNSVSIHDNGYFYHETRISPGMRHVDNSEAVQLNWPHCVGLPIWFVSVGLLWYQSFRSRKARQKNTPDAVE